MRLNSRDMYLNAASDQIIMGTRCLFGLLMSLFEKSWQVTYKIELKPGMELHPVFHDEVISVTTFKM